MINRTKNHREQKPQKNLKRKIKVISNKSMIAAKILVKNVIKSVFDCQNCRNCLIYQKIMAQNTNTHQLIDIYI